MGDRSRAACITLGIGGNNLKIHGSPETLAQMSDQLVPCPVVGESDPSLLADVHLRSGLDRSGSTVGRSSRILVQHYPPGPAYYAQLTYVGLGRTHIRFEMSAAEILTQLRDGLPPRIDITGPDHLTAARLWTKDVLRVAVSRAAHLQHLHAAAVRVGNGALLFVGPKGSGKTTTVLDLVVRGLGQYISNDRCVVGGNGPDVWGWPSHIRLTPSGVERLSRLHSLEAIAGQVRSSPLVNGKHAVSPALLRVFGKIVDHPVRVRAIILPKLAATFSVDQLPHQISRPRIEAELLPERDARWPHWSGFFPKADAVEVGLLDSVAELPCLEVAIPKTGLKSEHLEILLETIERAERTVGGP